MGDLTLAEVGRTLTRIEDAQAETARQVADLAKTVSLAFHGPTDQHPDRPIGIIPRLLQIEQYYKDQRNYTTGTWERVQAGIIAGVVSLIIHVVQNWDYMKGTPHQ